jgi:DNA ligase D-like protein (predicted ligase)/DNA ligase D-like protein (predicted 3'-phosphoesterase)
MRQYKPMLAESADEPFSSGDWIFEVKWDGIRAVSYVNSEISIRSRKHKELLKNFPELGELKKLVKAIVLDGEIIVMRGGAPDFQRTVERNQVTSDRDIEYMAKKHPATYVVFDILEKDGESLVDRPLIERKRVLDESLRDGSYVVKSVFVEGSGEQYYEAALKKGMEGVMAKKKTSKYSVGRRSNDWLKIKKVKAADCVIFGYTRGGGAREKGFGALILGLYDDETPVFVGKVGTGFSQKTILDLMTRFKKLESGKKTLGGFEGPDEVTWLKPKLVCEVGYQVVTKDGRLRMPRFMGLRSDKRARDSTVDQIRPKELKEYKEKRDFSRTPEPKSGSGGSGSDKSFVVHEHHARRLHYDLRLEREGVLKSWAVPKGPPEKPGDKRLAIHVEDHPLDYGSFEGTIPEGEYGAGTVKIWDKGFYEPLHWGDEKIEILMMGERLEGRYELVRFKRAGEKQWLFFKARDK